MLDPLAVFLRNTFDERGLTPIPLVSTDHAARDVLLLTDGLSNELDVQKLSQSGRRISVILIGESSLEAKIGHLAALTGGDIFVATADDLEAVTGTS